MMITQKRLKELLHYNPDTGVFVWRKSISSRAQKGRIAGSRHCKGYWKITLEGRTYMAHRLAWLYVYGVMPDQIDHKHHNKMDNRISELRDVSNKGNHQNMIRANKNSAIKFLGVSFHKKNHRFVAQITTDGRNKYIGSFDTPELAHAAYISEKRKLHATCTI